MARTAATIPAGMRLTDHVSLGVLTAQFPRELVDQLLFETESLNARERALPAHVMVYYLLALALYAEVSTQEVVRCAVERARWLGDSSDAALPTKAAISQARMRLGTAPLEALYRAVVARVATAGTPGAWYRGWRVMSLDGTTLDVGDTAANAAAFGRTASARGVNATGAFPQLRLVGLLEHSTHAITAAQLGPYGTHERVLAADVLAGLTGEMLCLAGGLPQFRSVAHGGGDRRGAPMPRPGDAHAAGPGALRRRLVSQRTALESQVRQRESAPAAGPVDREHVCPSRRRR